MSDNNLIPMINVVFLLLIFFMIAGVVRHSDPLLLTAPESTADTPISAQSVLYVAANGTMILDENPVSKSTLEATLTKLENQPVTHEEGRDISVNREPEDITIGWQGNKPVLGIKADAGVTVSVLRELMHTARKAGLSNVELITSWVPATER